MKAFLLLVITTVGLSACGHHELETPCRVSAAQTGSNPCEFLPINVAASKNESEQS